MIIYPSSIKHHTAVKRCFQSKNGELAFQLTDAEVFISACENVGLAVVKWEVWLVDHQLSFNHEPIFPMYSPGDWSGLIPCQDRTTAVLGGETKRAPEESWLDYVIRSARVTREQISAFEIEQPVDPSFAEFVRLNFLTQEDNA
jgi:hypothetical protein